MEHHRVRLHWCLLTIIIVQSIVPICSEYQHYQVPVIADENLEIQRLDLLGSLEKLKTTTKNIEKRGLDFDSEGEGNAVESLVAQEFGPQKFGKKPINVGQFLLAGSNSMHRL